MKIGLYNRYWNTRGGGERYAGVMAEVLSKGHDVELLGIDAVDLDALAGHLGLDLSRTRFRRLPPVGERELAPLTEDYDLFVNCTYLSRLPARARRSVYLVFFPQRSWPEGRLELARRALSLVTPERPALVLPLAGFHGVDFGGSVWSEERFRVRVLPAAFAAEGEAFLRFNPAGPYDLREAILEVEPPPGFTWRVEDTWLVLTPKNGPQPGETPPEPPPEPVELSVTCRTHVPSSAGASKDPRRLGLCLVGTGKAKPWSTVRGLLRRVEGRLDAHDPAIPAGYDLLLSISEYTRHWVDERWGRPSRILPPPVDTDRFARPPGVAKERVILSVGRFFHGAHNKKHVEMLQVFRDMCDRGEVPDGWEYHLVGNVHRKGTKHQRYFARVRELAEGYPVRILTDLALDDLVREYRRAAIFWHAAGWGEDENRMPEKLEHFGITTCEAMSAGCIPVVIAKAGQLEIVDPGETGFLFHDAAELASHTRGLIEGFGEPWVEKMGQRAVASVQRYSRDRFEERLLDILGDEGLLT